MLCYTAFLAGVLDGALPTCQRSCKDIKVPVGTTSMEFFAIAGDDNYGYLDVTVSISKH